MKLATILRASLAAAPLVVLTACGGGGGDDVGSLGGGALKAVTYDPANGFGFVGKGDVQTAFGWNNATAQSQATNVSFTYDSSQSYSVTIRFGTGNPDQQHSLSTHTVTQGKSSTVNSVVSSDPRRTGQYTGWNLTGLGQTTTTGDAVPAVGDSCPNGNLGDCEVIDVVSAGSTGGLYAHWGGQAKLLQ